MKKYISFIAVCAMILLGFNSCQNIESEMDVYGKGIHKVTFSAQLSDDTKTALELRIVPDWRNTPTSSIHLFETYNSSTVEGQNVSIETKEEEHYRKAYFTADFDETQTIIVDPPTTRASSNTYIYNAIIGKKVDDKYVIPAIQEPDQEISSLDPNADFLIGKKVETESRYQNEPLQIKFERPVALARLAFYGLEAGAEEKILSVKLEAVDPLTGSVSYDDINFEDGTTTFDTTDGSNTITLNYGLVGADQKSVFYAYFITTPGTHQISSVSLTTDKHVYTKSFETPVSLVFDIKNFKNIAVSMVGIEGKSNEDQKLDQTIEWMKNSQAITTDSYDLASNEAYVLPVVSGAQTNLTYESSKPEVATINDEGVITFVGVGETTIKATAAEDDFYNEATAEFVLTVTRTVNPNVTYYKTDILEPGYEYIVVSNGHAVQATTDGTAGAVEVTVENDQIVMAADASLIWTCEKPQTSLTEGTYTLSNNGKSLYRISSSGNFSLGVGEQPASLTKYYLWDYLDNHITHTSTGGSSTNHYWFYYTDGSWKFSYATSIPETNPTYLFTVRAPQTVSFTNVENAQIDMAAADKTFKATLEGVAEGANVTYASSDENVATVAADGTVTGVGKGTATITATVAGTSQYQGAEVSYTIEIINSAAVATKFYKVTSVTVGQSYLIVSNGQALKNDNGSIGTEAVTVNSDIIELEDYDALVWTAGTPVASDENYEGPTFANNGKYLYRSSTTLSLASSTSGKYNDYNYVAHSSVSGAYCLKTGGYNVYYDNGWKAGSSSSSTTATLYCSVAPKVERNLYFEDGDKPINKTVGDDQFTIVLWGEVYGGVEFESSNTNVATVAVVDESDCQVTIVGAGTTTITATVPETDKYASGTATVTLVVASGETPTGKTYTKVTSAPSDWSGTYLFVDDDAQVALAYNETTNYKTSVSIANGKIVSNDLTDYELTVTTSSVGTGKYDVTTSNGKYVYWYSNAFLNTYKTGTQNGSNTYYCTFSIDDGDVTMYSTRTGSNGSVNYIVYNGTKFTFTTTNSNTIQLYKLDDGTPTPQKEDRELSFDVQSVNKTFGDGTFLIELNGEQDGGVTFSSSDPSVATVNEYGDVTIVGAGETDIIAHADANETYNEGNASYHLTVARKGRGILFANTPVEKTVGDEPFTNPLNGITDGVTYESSNTAVATVNATSGLVTIVGAGQTTITASAAESSKYEAGSDYFILIVAAATTSDKTYSKATSFTSGKKYIIVDGTTALKNDNGTDAAFSVSGMINGNTLTLSASDAESLEWTATSNSSYTTQGNFTLKNGNYYLKRENTDVSNNDIVLSSATPTAYFVWTLDGSNLRQKNSSAQYTFYLNYTGSRWTANTQTAPNNITIYEEGEGGTTPPATTTKYYTKVTSSLPTSASSTNTTTWSNLLFVYDNGNGTGYAFKGNYSGTATVPNGSTESNSALLDTNNAVAVTITSQGIASSAAVDACALSMQFGTSSDNGKNSVHMENCDYWLRMLTSGTNAGKFAAMTSGGYRMTYTVASEGTNNVTANRSSYYFGFDGTSHNFVGTTSSSSFCIYKLSE